MYIYTYIHIYLYTYIYIYIFMLGTAAAPSLMHLKVHERTKQLAPVMQKLPRGGDIGLASPNNYF